MFVSKTFRFLIDNKNQRKILWLLKKISNLAEDVSKIIRKILWRMKNILYWEIVSLVKTSYNKLVFSGIWRRVPTASGV